MEPILDTNAASEVLTKLGAPRKPATLRKLRCTGGGPKFRRLGTKPVYTLSDLKAWIEERLSEAFGSNSEAEQRLSETFGRRREHPDTAHTATE